MDTIDFRMLDARDADVLEQLERRAYIENWPQAPLLGAMLDLLRDYKAQEELDY